jgi:hypothetical protein
MMLCFSRGLNNVHLEIGNEDSLYRMKKGVPSMSKSRKLVRSLRQDFHAGMRVALSLPANPLHCFSNNASRSSEHFSCIRKYSTILNTRVQYISGNSLSLWFIATLASNNLHYSNTVTTRHNGDTFTTDMDASPQVSQNHRHPPCRPITYLRHDQNLPIRRSSRNRFQELYRRIDTTTLVCFGHPARPPGKYQRCIRGFHTRRVGRGIHS